MKIQQLPPKMALQLAERAKRGDYDNYVGSNIYEFYSGNIVTCLIGLEHPTGHVQKVSSETMKRHRAIAKKRVISDNPTIRQAIDAIEEENIK